jgi:hypothetical protein
MDLTLFTTILLALTVYKFVLIPLHTILSRVIFTRLRKIINPSDGQTRGHL